MHIIREYVIHTVLATRIHVCNEMWRVNTCIKIYFSTLPYVIKKKNYIPRRKIDVHPYITYVYYVYIVYIIKYVQHIRTPCKNQDEHYDVYENVLKAYWKYIYPYQI